MTGGRTKDGPAPLDCARVVDILQAVLPPARPVALHEPCLGEGEAAALRDCLDSGWVSSAGPFVDRFERRLAERLEVPAVVATVNGTAALHVALLLAGAGPGTEVLVPALTFVATANAVSYCGAVPHFVDSEEATLGIDPARLDRYLETLVDVEAGRPVNRRTGRRLAALVPMHVFGHPVDMDRLTAVAARWNLPVVEDAAEALGSRYRGGAAGALAPLGVLSFNGNKIVTTGGGGAIVAADPEVARAARHLTTTAKLPHRWDFVHDRVAYNYRLPNLNAALGVAQLDRLDGFVAAKRALALRYARAFAGVEGLRLFIEPDGARSNYWLNALILDEAADEAAAAGEAGQGGAAGLRDRLLAATNDAGILTRPAWRLLHRLPMYAACPRMPLPVAAGLERRILNLPSSPALGPPAAAG